MAPVMDTPAAVADRRATHLRVLLAILLAALAGLVFLPALNGQLLSWDDYEFIHTNPRLHYLSLDSVVDFFRLQPRYGASVFALYVPLTLLSVAAEYHFFGDVPGVYHATNILLHACNTALVFVLAALLTKRTRLAFLTALCFAVHPFHVESVAWVTERKDVLCSFFYLFALVFYVRWMIQRRFIWYAAAVAAAVGATLSKPLAVSLPLVLFLCDFLLRCRWSWSRLWEKLPFLVMAVLGMAATLYVQGRAGAVESREALNLHANLFVALRGILFYVVKILAPTNLQPIYLRPQVINVFGGVTMLSVLVTGGLLYAAWRYRQRLPIVTFGLGLFFVTLAPMLQVVPSGLQIVAAPRFMYIPGIGLFLIMASGADYMMRHAARRTKGLLWLLMGVLCTWWATLTWQLATVWQTDISLWSYTLAHQPKLVIAKTNLAIGNMVVGNLREARRMYEELLATETNALLLANLAATCFNMGDITQAERYAYTAFDYDPEKSQAHYVAAAVATRFGNHTNAIALLREVIRREPMHAEARVHLAESCVCAGATNEAISALQDYLRLERDDALAMLNLAHLYEQTGALGNARTMYSGILRVRPTEHNVRYRRGLMCLRQRDFAAAHADFIIVTAAAPRHAMVLSDLAIVERERGNPAAALRGIEQAAALQPKSPKILYDYACILALQNRAADAIVALTNALARDARLPNIARQDPDLATLRTNQAVQAWLR